MSSTRRVVAFVVVFFACTPKSPPPPPPGGGGPAPATGPTIADIVAEDGNTYQISQGVRGEPAAVGCADGQREAFVDAAAFPTIAGCIAEWAQPMTLRAPATGAACGDDLGVCGAPADACAPGWHLCSADGGIDEVAAIGAEACDGAGGGRFVAAISHCASQEGCEIGDPQTATYQCYEGGWCSEPVCCGKDCATGACPSGIWADRTRIAIGTDQGCGMIGSSRARGVLCCKG